MTKAAELAKIGEVLTNSQLGGRRNIIINGAMQVAQRGTSATVGATNNDYATMDRFKIIADNTAGRATMSQSTDSPSGFASSLKLDCSTADTSIAASEQFALATCIEGQDLQQIKKGTSDAEKITLSFYVKGNANATYNVEVADFDNTRHNTQTFSVTTSWNRIVMTFDADTSGALDNDNATSLQINWYFHAGSDYTSGTFTENTWQSRVSANRVKSSNTSFFDSTDRTFFITGVQLEVGSQATPFEHRSFGEELALCQRYYYQSWGFGAWASNIGPGYAGQVLPAPNNSSSQGTCSFPVAMRATPTVTTYDSLGASGTVTQPAIANGIAATAGSISVSGFFGVTKDSGTFTVGTPVIGQFKASIEL